MNCIPLDLTCQMNIVYYIDPPGNKIIYALTTSRQNLADKYTLADVPPQIEQGCLEY